MHLTDKRWREVTLLTVGMLPNADKCLRQMKRTVDELLAGDEKLQRFLVWVDEKARSVDDSSQPAAIPAFYRAFYFDLDLDFDLSLYRAFSFSPHFSPEYALKASAEIDPELKLKLDILISQLPNSQDARELWQENGQAWKNQLRAGVIEYPTQVIKLRNIGHDWQFSDAQKKLLQQYYDANKLLVDCLNSDCYISRSVREEIEATLLLPIAETMQRQPLEKPY